MHNIIALWSHLRARSTAFARMMIARGDVVVIHEPLGALVDDGKVTLPDGRGGDTVVTSEKSLFGHLRMLAADRPVFFKETVENRYDYLFERPGDVADIMHTFIIRDPRPTISSAYSMKPDIVSPWIGYEHLHEIFVLSRGLSPRAPILVNSDDLLRDPASVISAYCERVGLPFDPEALSWKAGAQPEWQRTQRWHEDVSRSSSFSATEKNYPETVDNNELLNGFYRYHGYFYQQLVKHCI